MRAWFDREYWASTQPRRLFELSVEIYGLDRTSVVAESVEYLVLYVFVEQYSWLHRLIRPAA